MATGRLKRGKIRSKGRCRSDCGRSCYRNQDCLCGDRPPANFDGPLAWTLLAADVLLRRARAAGESDRFDFGQLLGSQHRDRRLRHELDLAVFHPVDDCRICFQGIAGDSNMKRLCGAGALARLRGSDTRSGRDCSFRLERMHFAGRSARVTRVLLIAIIFLPALAHAYAGPGAGFAVLSSFWAIFVAFLYSFYALMTWPFRQLFRFIRRRNVYGKATFERAVILGFDGMDPDLADRFMKEGRLPNLAKFRDKGTFSKLRTTFPPISPVAWSTFMTGVNPGKHNIYDFLARDTSNYLPFLSSAQIKGPKRHIKIGKYSIPFGKTEIKGMRKGTPFWHWLGKAGIFSSVIRVPVTFPPEKFQGVLLSGMCVPDLKGSQGTFCLCTTRM